MNEVPRPVKQGVPVALAVITAYRAYRQVQEKMRERQHKKIVEDLYVAS